MNIPNPLNPNPTPPNNYWTNIFANLLYHIVEKLKIHGLSYIVMIVFAYYLYQEVNELRKEVKQCNSDVVELYHKDQEDTRGVIQANTEVLKDLRKQIK